MKIQAVVAILTIFLSNIVSGQQLWEKQPLKGVSTVCYASGKVEKSFIPPPDEYLKRLKSGVQTSEIIVNYVNFPDSVRKVFDYAVGIWESFLSSKVPIYMTATWTKLGAGTLASCGPSNYFINFDGSPNSKLYYAVALAEKLSEKQTTGADDPDIEASFNSSMPWYYGTDGETPTNKYDLVSTILHEIAHGLGFIGFLDVNTNNQTGYWGNGDNLAAAFDEFVENAEGKRIINPTLFTNNSSALYKEFTSNQLFTGSPAAVYLNKKVRPQLYAPLKFNPGSSIYHLNDQSYPYGNSNSLMTHAAGLGEAIHDPGAITRGIMADLGWKHLFIRFQPLKDVEALTEPLSFQAKVESEVGLDSASVKLIFSKDEFKTHTETLNMPFNSGSGNFEVQYTPTFAKKNISYYIVAKDTMQRLFTLPAKAPANIYTVAIGPDSLKPVIVHTPAEFILSSATRYEVKATVTDNIGVNSVYVIYSVNGVQQPTVYLVKGEKDQYSALIDLSKTKPIGGTQFEYTIYARDASTTRNLARLPENNIFSLKVETINQPVTQYFNNFNSSTADFLLGAYTIGQLTGFDNGALHSPHPYPSPNKDNSNFEFTSLLRFPIILNNDMLFTFDEIVLVEPGETGAVFGSSNFWDYVVVEGSKDNGTSWKPLVNGYDSGSELAWLTRFNSRIVGNNSLAVGSKELFAPRKFSPVSNGNFKSGDTILVRFRLFSDPYSYGWGWAIDNFTVRQIASAVKAPTLLPGNFTLWPNPFTNQLKLNISGEKIIGQLQIEVFDITGRKVYNMLVDNVLPGSEIHFNATAIPSGLCIFSVSADGLPVLKTKLVKH